MVLSPRRHPWTQPTTSPKQNEIVRYLLDAGPFDMNQLAALPFSQDDRNQFAQLIGYSVDGFAELSYADPARVEWADRQGSVL